MNELHNLLTKLWDDAYSQGHDGLSNNIRPATINNKHWIWHFLPTKLNKNTVMLEIGCGTGNHIAYLHPLVNKIFGMDVSKVAIEYSEKRFKELDNVNLMMADNLNNYKDNFFDIIFELTVFQHMDREDVKEYFAEFKKKIKDDGFIFCQFLYNSFEDKMSTSKDVLPVMSWNEKQIREAVEEANLKVYSLSYWDISWQVNWGHEYGSYYLVCTKD